MQKSIISGIEKLYRELPQVDCQGCGVCCVSPTCTLSEFIYLFHHLQDSLSAEQLEKYILSPPAIHPDCDGNLRCSFLAENRCAVHWARTGACRLFGIPSLEKLDLPNLEKCRNNITVISGKGDITFIQAWLEKLYSLEKMHYNYGIEPYFIKGFNIHCWLDIYFDDSLDFDVFYNIKATMNHYLDLSRYKKKYTFHTGLKEKTDKIGILSTLIGSGDSKSLHSLLISIRDDYPACGTYFYDEAAAFLKILDKNE